MVLIILEVETIQVKPTILAWALISTMTGKEDQVEHHVHAEI
jgi:hypothetical protein